MAIDLTTSRVGLDRNKYYKGQYVNKMKLTAGAIAEGVFYSTDAEPIQKSVIVNGSTRHRQTIVKILTEDYIPDLEIDDFVLYGGDNELYKVDAISSADKIDKAKQFLSHANKYVITMRR